MAVNDLNGLLKHELGDLYFAEKTILKALKKMTKEVSDPAINERMVQHQSETEEQIANIEQAFEAIGLKPRAQKCPGILGILEEHDEFKEEEEPSKELLEAFDVGSGLRVEHYEIAAYGTARQLADDCGFDGIKDLMDQTLDEESQADKLLTKIATGGMFKSGVNQQATS